VQIAIHGEAKYMTEILSKKITLQNSCDLIGKTKDVFAPIKEAIINSFDSITQRQKTDKAFTPSIFVSVYFKENKDLFEEKSSIISSVSIEDNGIGFTSENLQNLKDILHNPLI
jgi:DNA topoisomerase VI subunit B